MAITVNTNVGAINAQRNIHLSQGAMNRSIRRLASGLRINSARDDSAGLAISDRMTSQIRGLNQAARNANDGISMAQTAEGALQESTNILQRIRELAVQSANDSNSNVDRVSLQAEVTQLKSELDRIAENTTFNSHKLLDGSQANRVFHIGANEGQNISLSINSFATAELGVAGGGGTTTPNTHITLLAHQFTSGVELDALNNFMQANFSTMYNDPGRYNPSNGHFFNSNIDATAVTNALNATFSGVTFGRNTTGVSAWSTGIYVSGSGASAEFTTNATTTTGGSGTTKTINDVSVLSVEEANITIASVDEALKEVSSERGKLGAIQSRLESTISNLQNVAENLSASRSRIMDADIASETSAMTKSTILQQAGISVLTQANQQPQLALSLLN